jgi:hypothetical protein
MSHKQTTQHHSIVKASFVVSEKISKHSMSFGEGEFIKECLVDVASTVDSRVSGLMWRKGRPDNKKAG